MLKDMVIDENNIGFIPSLGISFQLNEVAKEIIELIKEGKKKDEIVELISSKYKKSWEEIYIDIEDFFYKLKIYGVYDENSN